MLAILLFSLLGCSFLDSFLEDKTPLPKPQDTGLLPAITITVVDVAHGDCIILQSEDGKTMMIDTGAVEAKSAVLQALDNLSISYIDILLLTHPHTDHIGNASYLLENIPVGTVHMTKKVHTTKLYDSLLASLEKVNPPMFAAELGASFEFCGIQFVYVGPAHLDYKDINDTSAVLYGVYGNTTMLFTGDQLVTAEEDLIKNYPSMRIDFLKVGHHANNSSSTKFLAHTRPKVSVVSMSPLEDYAQPQVKTDVFQRLKRHCPIYRTDQLGTLTFINNGVEILFQPSS